MSGLSEAKYIPWADATKAACICLVVVMHCEAQLPLIGWKHYSQVAQTWHDTNRFLEPIRMPSFFLMSGLLSGTAIASQRAGAFLKYGIQPLYLYILWSVIYATVLSRYPHLGPVRFPDHSWISKALFMGTLGWYLYALSLFYLFSRVTRDLPAAPMLAVCGLIALSMPFMRQDWTSYPYMLIQYLFFFLAGARYKDVIVAWAAQVSTRKAAILFAVYATASLLALRSDAIVLPLNVLGVALSIAFFACTFRYLGLFSPVMRWTGRRTLFIYLLHFPLLCLVTAGLKAWAAPWILESYWLGLAFPLVTAMLVVPACLAIGAWTHRCKLRWLFQLPTGRHDMVQAGDIPARSGDGSIPA